MCHMGVMLSHETQRTETHLKKLSMTERRSENTAQGDNQCPSETQVKKRVVAETQVKRN